MPILKNKFKKINRTYFLVAGIILLILTAVSLLWFNYNNSMQSYSTVSIELYFEGDYRIADGPWQPYVAGEHIPATKGDVTLRGNLYKRYEGENLGVYRFNPEAHDPDDIKAAFYVNHINLTFCELDENKETTCRHMEV